MDRERGSKRDRDEQGRVNRERRSKRDREERQLPYQVSGQATG